MDILKKHFFLSYEQQIYNVTICVKNDDLKPITLKLKECFKMYQLFPDQIKTLIFDGILSLLSMIGVESLYCKDNFHYLFFPELKKQNILPTLLYNENYKHNWFHVICQHIVIRVIIQEYVLIYMMEYPYSTVIFGVSFFISLCNVVLFSDDVEIFNIHKYAMANFIQNMMLCFFFHVHKSNILNILIHKALLTFQLNKYISSYEEFLRSSE